MLDKSHLLLLLSFFFGGGEGAGGERKGGRSGGVGVRGWEGGGVTHALACVNVNRSVCTPSCSPVCESEDV